MRRIPSPDGSESTWALLYQQDDDHSILVAWIENEEAHLPIWIGQPNETLTNGSVKDMMGNPIHSMPIANGCLVELGAEPIYIELNGHSPYPLLQSIIKPDPFALVLPGEETTISVNLRNPHRQAVQAQLSVHANTPKISFPDGNTITCILQPEAQLTVPVKLQAMPDLSSKSSVVDFDLQLDGISLPTARIPCVIGQLIPKRSISTGFPLDLAGRDHIHNLYEAEPSSDMQWAGPDDLSAESALSYDEKALYLSVKTVDQVHVQPTHRNNLWQADSLQIGMRLDESRIDSYLEFGLSLTESEESGGWVYSSPGGVPIRTGELPDTLGYTISRNNTRTDYEVIIPWQLLGADGPVTTPFRLNFIVNDDDGKGRKQWLQITPGIGEQKNANLFPLFLCR